MPSTSAWTGAITRQDDPVGFLEKDVAAISAELAEIKLHVMQLKVGLAVFCAQAGMPPAEVERLLGVRVEQRLVAPASILAKPS